MELLSMGFSEIATDYIQHHRKRAAAELSYFRNFSSDEDAVSVAALGEYPKGKRHSHQRRVPPAALRESQQRLIASLDAVRAVTSFDELIDLLEATIRRIPGIGELPVYDTAVRIGARLGLEPSKVYLHRGTREGAAALGLDTKKHALDLDDLPVELRILAAREAEDVLCIYKQDLAQAVRGEPSGVPMPVGCDRPTRSLPGKSC